MRHPSVGIWVLSFGVLAAVNVSAVMSTAPFAKKAVIVLGAAKGHDPVSDVPVAIRLSENVQGFSYAHVAANGADLRFTDADGNLLMHDVETWNPDGESVVWVKVPTLPATPSSLTMYYQAEDPASLPAVTGADVWSRYRGVWHLDDTGSAIAEASGKVAAGSVPNTAYTKVSDAGVFGTSVLISNSDTKSDNNGGIAIPSFDMGATFTVSTWVKHRLDTFYYDHLLFRKAARTDSNGWCVEMNESGTSFRVTGARGGDADVVNITPRTALKEWTHLAFAFNGTSLTAYQDGVRIGTGTITPATDNGKIFALGNDTDIIGSGSRDVAWHGWMDEVRVSLGGETDEAIATEFAAMDPSSNFVMINPVTPVGVAEILVSMTSLALADDNAGGLGILATGSLDDFGGHTQLNVRLRWGTTDQLEGTPVDLGVKTLFGTVTAVLPASAGLQQGTTYYLAFEATGAGGQRGVTETRAIPYYAGLTWNGAVATDTWSSPVWMPSVVGADPVMFTAGQNVVLPEAAALKTVVVDQPVTAARVTVDATSDYVLDGTAKLASAEFVKTGTGTLTITGEGLADGSKVTVRQGVLTLDHASENIGATPFGVDTVVTVEEGAAVDLNLPGELKTDAAKNNRTRSMSLRLAGKGPDGAGALVNRGPNGWNAAVSRIELTDDATIGGPSRIDVRPAIGIAREGYIKGDGKTLTIANAGRVNVVGGDVIDVAKIVVTNGGMFAVEDSFVEWNVPDGITLTGNGGIVYRYNNVEPAVTIPDGDEGQFVADSATGIQKGAVTIGADATLHLRGNGMVMRVDGPVVNRGTILADGNGPHLNGPLSGPGTVQSVAGCNLRLGGGFTTDVLRVSLAGGMDLGCPGYPGYPKVSGIVGLDGSPFDMKGDIYLRAGGNGTVDEVWDAVFNSAGANGRGVFCYQETASVTTTLDHVNWTIPAFYMGQPAGEAHVALVNGSKITVTNTLVLGYGAAGPRSASLDLGPGTEVTVTKTEDDSFAQGQQSGAANGVFAVTVDGGTFRVPDGSMLVGKDGPYAYFTAKNGALVQTKSLGVRTSTGARGYPNGDERFTLTGGSTVEIGSGALRVASVRPNLPGYDFEDGTVRATEDWDRTTDWPSVAFGSNPRTAGNVTFDLNGKTVRLKGAIGGASAVTLKGPGSFTTYNTLQAQPVGKWMVDAGVTADFSGFSGFAGGLELGENASAKMNVNVQGERDEGLVEFGMLPASGYAAGKVYCGTLPQRVDNLDQLHARTEEGAMQNTAFMYRGQFFVPEAESGTWYFAGSYDDNVYLEIDGTEAMLCTTWNGVGTGTRELTAGWHDFRTVVYDGTGGQGPSVSGWKGVMALGWTRAAPSDAKAAANYTKFDNTTLRMRPPTNTLAGVRWQVGRCRLIESQWEKYGDPVFASHTNIFSGADVMTNNLSCINIKGGWALGQSRESRFLGYFKVDDDKAGDWAFKGRWDDRIALRIDDQVVLSTTSWDQTKDGTCRLDAGWHAFDIRVADGTGGWGPTGAVKDADGVDAGLVVTTPGGRAAAFDERKFRILPTVYDIANDKGTGLGGDILINEGSILENTGTRGYCPVRGRLMGSGKGTLKGAFRMAGGTLVIPGPGSRVKLETRFADMDANFLAGLGAIELDLAGQATFGKTAVCDAYGLAPAAAAAIPVTATMAGVDAETAEKYDGAFSAAVENGRLVVRNARGGGMVFFIR